MSKYLYILVLIVLNTATDIMGFNSKRSLQKVKSFFKGASTEKIDQKELSAISINTISINNINGPVTIETGWKKNSILLKTTKKAKKQEDLNNIKIAIDTTKENHLAITTNHINKKLTGLVEYKLIVPSSLDVAITISGYGDAFVKDVNGAINIIANDSVTVINTRKSISTQTNKRGETFITNAFGPVNAISNNGNITGTNIANNFIAHSTTGKVNVAYDKLPAASVVHLETKSGHITLTLPTETNARIKGQTVHGTLLSEHPIMLNSYVTKLDTAAWNKFKKEVDGTLGSGDATISLHSTHGSVKINETKVT